MLYYRKRESNTKHKLKITILIGLMVISSLFPRVNSLSSNVVLTILRPANQFISYVTNVVVTTVDNIIGTKPNRDMVAKLEHENNELKNEISRLQYIVDEEPILKNVAKIQADHNFLSAKVIAIDTNDSFNNFIIDKGQRQGVNKGDIIVTAYRNGENSSMGALVGKIEEVYLNTSKVASIMDDRFNLTFMQQGTNDFGIINSRFSGKLEGYMLDKNAVIKQGDKLLTSGIGGVYQKGILIGEVIEVSESTDELLKLVKIESPVNFTRIYDVFVVDNGVVTDVEN